MLLLLCVLATVVAPGLGAVFQMPTVTPANASDIWAVLVAGSNEWFNYRHQADLCHAYQILHAHGVPDDHIIVMMYDDIAHNKLNPVNGTIINRPGGPNVYEGVPKDYVGAAVTPENFLQIITGNATGLDKVGSGKVLKSTNTSHVFINLVDHGAPGIFGFPFHIHPTPGHHPPPKLPVLKARDFIGAIEKMNNATMYKEMVIYLESCESGSMFKKILPKNISVFAVTAANAKESSWGCYFNKTMKTALGDVFSVKWMEDTDRENVTIETLHHQLHKVKKEVTTSHVMHYGNVNISSEVLGTFMGNKTANLTLSSWGPFPPHHDPCMKTALASSEIPIASLNAHLDEAIASNNADDITYWQSEIAELQNSRNWMDGVFTAIIKHQMQYGFIEIVSDEDFDINNWDCYEANLQVLNDECFDLSSNTYALEHLQKLVNMCELGYDTDSFHSAVHDVCVHDPPYGIV